jgi:uncharacterized membrane protein YfcA
MAIPLSQAIIFGGSLMAFALKVGKKHPLCNRPLIDYQMAMCLQAPILLGTSIGVKLNTMFPEWLILILLTTLLIFMAKKTVEKGRALFKKETEEKVEGAAAPSTIQIAQKESYQK